MNVYMNVKKFKRIVVNITCFIAGVTLGIFLMSKFLVMVCKNKDRRITMFSDYFYTLDKWMKLTRKRCTLDNYLTVNNFNSIAIYGVGIMGKQLLSELEKGETRVIYAIDQNCKNRSYEFPIKTIEDNLESVDLIIVTPSYDFDQIKSTLQRKLSCPIISLYQLIEEWYEQCI